MCNGFGGEGQEHHHKNHQVNLLRHRIDPRVRERPEDRRGDEDQQVLGGELDAPAQPIVDHRDGLKDQEGESQDQEGAAEADG